MQSKSVCSAVCSRFLTFLLDRYWLFVTSTFFRSALYILVTAIFTANVYNSQAGFEANFWRFKETGIGCWSLRFHLFGFPLPSDISSWLSCLFPCFIHSSSASLPADSLTRQILVVCHLKLPLFLPFLSEMSLNLEREMNDG